jgi:carbonic anhydrase/acetyltransferase-like protein (isoleucine patch superfamily)
MPRDIGQASGMLIRHRGAVPTVDPTAYVAPTAVVMGAVVVGAHARVMAGAVLDAEGSTVDVGERVIVAEHAVLRATGVGDRDYPVRVGDQAFVGPHATLLGCTIEPAVYVATGATVVHGAVVGSGAVVAVGALVHAGALLPREFFLAPSTVAVGDPVAVYTAGDPQLPQAIKDVEFVGRAFGVEPAGEDRATTYRRVAQVRADEFAAHLEDEIIDG